MRRYRNIFLDSGFALAGATAYLYCAGTAYYGGYWGTLKLDSDVLGRSFHHVLYQGFLVSFVITLWMLLGATFASFCYAYIALPAWIDWVSKGVAQKRRVARLKRVLLGRRKSSFLEAKAKRNFWFWLKGFGAVVIFLLLLAHFESEGKLRANNLLEESAEHNLPQSSIITVKAAGNTHSLVFLGCGSKICAGLDSNTHRVFYYDYHFSSYVLPVPKQKNR